MVVGGGDGRPEEDALVSDKFKRGLLGYFLNPAFYTVTFYTVDFFLFVLALYN